MIVSFVPPQKLLQEGPHNAHNPRVVDAVIRVLVKVVVAAVTAEAVVLQNRHSGADRRPEPAILGSVLVLERARIAARNLDRALQLLLVPYRQRANCRNRSKPYDASPNGVMPT